MKIKLFHKFNSLNTHQRKYKNELISCSYYPKTSQIMRRKQFMIDLNEIYNKNMKTELKLNVDIVNTTLGLIEIIPIEAINLSHLKKSIVCKIKLWR